MEGSNLSSCASTSDSLHALHRDLLQCLHLHQRQGRSQRTTRERSAIPVFGGLSPVSTPPFSAVQTPSRFSPPALSVDDGRDNTSEHSGEDRKAEQKDREKNRPPYNAPGYEWFYTARHQEEEGCCFTSKLLLHELLQPFVLHIHSLRTCLLLILLRLRRFLRRQRDLDPLVKSDRGGRIRAMLAALHAAHEEVAGCDSASSLHGEERNNNRKKLDGSSSTAASSPGDLLEELDSWKRQTEGIVNGSYLLDELDIPLPSLQSVENKVEEGKQLGESSSSTEGYPGVVEEEEDSSSLGLSATPQHGVREREARPHEEISLLRKSKEEESDEKKEIDKGGEAKQHEVLHHRKWEKNEASSTEPEDTSLPPFSSSSLSSSCSPPPHCPSSLPPSSTDMNLSHSSSSSSAPFPKKVIIALRDLHCYNSLPGYLSSSRFDSVVQSLGLQSVYPSPFSPASPYHQLGSSSSLDHRNPLLLLHHDSSQKGRRDSHPAGGGSYYHHHHHLASIHAPSPWGKNKEERFLGGGGSQGDSSSSASFSLQHHHYDLRDLQASANTATPFGDVCHRGGGGIVLRKAPLLIVVCVSIILLLPRDLQPLQLLLLLLRRRRILDQVAVSLRKESLLLLQEPTQKEERRQVSKTAQ